MRAVVCREFGPVSGLGVEEIEEVEPGPRQVVVEVEAAGVNFVDVVILTGRYQFSPSLPYIPGSEVAGRVVRLGAEAHDVAVGTRVVCSPGSGGFAERVAVGVDGLIELPEEVDAAVGATVLQSYSTAIFALTRRDHVLAGETILVLGAGGGVGLACVDVATSLGARVVAAASSATKRAAALAAGAVATIDTSSEDLKARARDLSGGGVDVVIDPVGGDLSEPALRALGFGGRYHVIGFAGGAIPRIPLNLVLLNSRTVIGIEWGGWLLRQPDVAREVGAEIVNGLSTGRFHPAAPTVLALEAAAEALSALEGRQVTGKLALSPSTSPQ